MVALVAGGISGATVAALWIDAHAQQQNTYLRTVEDQQKYNLTRGQNMTYDEAKNLAVNPWNVGNHSSDRSSKNSSEAALAL